MAELESMLSYSFVTSPMLFLVTALLGVLTAWRWRRTGLVTALLSLLVLDALATPVVANRLLGWAEGGPVPAPSGAAPPGAIVVLGGDIEPAETPGDYEAGRLSLQRVYWAAQEFRATHLPILVSGGIIGPAQSTIADLMAATLETGFGVPVTWREERSMTTYEDAEYSAAILREHGISTILLVTQPFHMPRGAWAFRHFGIAVIPARQPSVARARWQVGDFLPQINSLTESYFAAHELLGLLYYRTVLR